MGIDSLPKSASAAVPRAGLAKAAPPASGLAGAAEAFAELLAASLDESADTDTKQAAGEPATLDADWLQPTPASDLLLQTRPVVCSTVELGLGKPAPPAQPPAATEPAATELAGEVLAKVGQRSVSVLRGQSPEGSAAAARQPVTKSDALASAQPEATPAPPMLSTNPAGDPAKALLPAASPEQSAVARAQRAAKDPARLAPLTPDALSEPLIHQNSNKVEPQAAPSYWLPVEGPAFYIEPPALALSDAAPRADIPAALKADQQLAQTISYWLGQGVQNAELKLDGFGAEPVAVRISVAHGEAHIGFKSDQAEARQLIEGALSQLRDLLGQEGLTLAGVSIGSSDQHPPGAQEQRPRFGPRKKDTNLLGTAASSSPPTLTRLPAGRVLDLFV